MSCSPDENCKIHLNELEEEEQTIPSLLLVNEDIISPIKVLFDATEKMVTKVHSNNETADQAACSPQLHNPRTNSGNGRKAVPGEKRMSKHQKNQFQNSELSFQTQAILHSSNSSLHSSPKDERGFERLTRRRKSDCPSFRKGKGSLKIVHCRL